MENHEKMAFLYVPCYTENLSRCWEKVLNLGRKVVFHNNENFNIGANGEIFGYITKGMIVSYFGNQNGLRDEIRSFIGPGCLIKETQCACGYGDFISTHKAIGETEIHFFNFSMIHEKNFFLEHRDLIKNIQFSLAAKSLSFQVFCSILKQRSVLQKVAFFAYGLWLQNGKSAAFKPQLTQMQVAELLGISNLTINRIVSNWKKEALLTCWTKNRMEINDPEKIGSLRWDDRI